MDYDKGKENDIELIRKDFPVTKNFAQILIAHFRQRRVHHQYQTDGYWDVGCSNLKAIDEALDAGIGVAQTHTYRHSRKYPKREIPVEE